MKASSLFQGLEPSSLFSFFEQISSIPRASGMEEQIADFLCEFAKKRSLSYRRDSSHNVVIQKPASSDKKDQEALILQAHTDMVFVTDEQHRHRSPSQGIELCLDDTFLYAKGTSLGADNGAGVAMMLAIADDLTLSHPPLELIFTASEEIGLLGAKALDLRILKGKRMINLDNDEEGFAVIGCAGGRRIDGVLPLRFAPLPPREGLRFCLSGLSGGHSGADISLGRTNALKLMSQLLLELFQKHPFSLSDLSGGTVDNAICSSCQGMIVAQDPKDTPALYETLSELFACCYPRIQDTDPHGTLHCEYALADKQLSLSQTKALLALFQRMPHGVRSVNAATQTVQSSQNLAFCRIENKDLHVGMSVRSSRETEKEALCREFCHLLSSAGCSVSQRGDYPGWEPNPHSVLQSLYRKVYFQLTKKEARCLPIHAGLECGVFAQGIADLDAISIGPNCQNIHTPQERLCIRSFAKTYHLLTTLISQC